VTRWAPGRRRPFPLRRMWSRHSLRSVRATCSAMALAFGARNGVSSVSMPSLAARGTKSPPKMRSRSGTRYLGWRPQGVASMSCRHTQAAVGCAVTAMCTNSRRPCEMKKRTERVRHVSVCSIRKSAAQMAWAWFRRKVRKGLARRPRRGPPAVAADGAVADGDPELEQLAPAALGAPQPVLLREPADQVPHFLRQPWPPGRPPGAPPPAEAPALPMPAQHRLRLHQHEMPAPVGHEASRHDPAEPVVPAHTGTPAGVQRDGELLPREQVLHQERMPASECGEHDADEECHPIQPGVMNAYRGSRRTQHGRSSCAPHVLHSTMPPLRDAPLRGHIKLPPRDAAGADDGDGDGDAQGLRLSATGGAHAGRPTSASSTGTPPRSMERSAASWKATGSISASSGRGRSPVRHIWTMRLSSSR
jgi:hypothetical protein